MEVCDLLPQHEVLSDVGFARLHANQTFARIPKDDPMSRALAAPGAQIVDAQDFRMCCEMGVRGTPFAVSFDE